MSTNRFWHSIALRSSLAVALAIFSGASTPCSAASSPYVDARVPIVGKSVEIGAMRPAGLSPRARDMTPAGHPSNSWTKLANLPGATVHDVAFATPMIGYAAAELGQVWKTTDGGTTWTLILNRNFPYYYYGIYATGQKVVASGFDDSNSNAILTESDDGGTTWSADTVLSTNDWAGRVRFTRGVRHGLAMSGEGLASPNAAWWTDMPNHWAQDTPDPNGGWFGFQFTLLKDKSAYASGITFCKSTDTGATWSCAPPADKVFDGPTEFVNDLVGWTGGGEIAPNVAGWLHRTTDGGATWSGRVLNAPWPIREIEFLNRKIGWAAGGNIYSGAGGIYFSSDGGRKWNLDLQTVDEVGSCAKQSLGNGQTQVWCIGDAYNGSSFSSNVYSTVVSTP
ncbi:MAG TPA: hypothetical protein VGI20_13300 [Rhizomicrobium sp.]|jgi:photosystem II stability/assembly factor-like uncharacterized protein